MRSILFLMVLFAIEAGGYAGILELSVCIHESTCICHRVGPDLFRCALQPGTESVLFLEARTDPDEGVWVWAEGLPYWAEFRPAFGHGEVGARCSLLPPPGNVSLRVTFRAETASGLSSSLVVELVPTSFTRTGNTRLDWDDFQGTPPASSGDAVAQIVYELSFRYTCEAVPADGGFVAHLTEVEVRLEVRRDLSWVYPWARTPEVLRHEQGHLDLAEVYRRLLLRELSGLRVSGRTPAEAISQLGERARAIFQQVKARMEKAQKLYDSASAHGKDPTAQREWEGKISRWLRDPASAP